MPITLQLLMDCLLIVRAWRDTRTRDYMGMEFEIFPPGSGEWAVGEESRSLKSEIKTSLAGGSAQEIYNQNNKEYHQENVE